MSSDLANAVLPRARAAQAAGDAEGALSQLAACVDQLDCNRELALLWLDLERMKAVAKPALAQITRIVGAWPSDPEIVTRACDVWIRSAEIVPLDEPPTESGPAQLAAAAAERCLQALAPESAAQRKWLGYLLASKGNAERLAHAYDAALASFERLIAFEPARGSAWFNLGLLHKARRDWQAALSANQRARSLLGDVKPVLWNLAIAATALGDGATAVEALQKLGFEAQTAASGMPYVDRLPPVQVRAATIGAGLGPGTGVPERSVGFELLWVTALSPCHGVVSSASYRDATIDYGDLVLWDGVPVGIVDHAGKAVPRFPLLALLKRGGERRFRFVALQQAEGQLAALGAALPEGCQLFVHHEQVERLCVRCATGEHLHKHEHDAPDNHRLAFGKLVLPASADLETFRGDLEGCLRAHPGVQLVAPALLEALGDTPAAGKAHQIWRGLVRSGLKLESL